MPNFTQINSPFCGPPLGLCGKSSFASRKAFTTAPAEPKRRKDSNKNRDVLLYLLVRIEHHLPLSAVKKSDWKRHWQFAAACFAKQATTHAGLHRV